MANFATVEDLATHLQRTFSAADSATADQLLALATSEIKAYTGQFLEAQTGVVDKFRGRDNRILVLSQIPVSLVTSVMVDGVAFVDYDLNARAGIITRNDWLSWYANELIVVTYNSGYSPIDPALKGVCLGYAARMMTNPESGIASETVGEYAVSYVASGRQFNGLDDVDRVVLDRFRAK